MGFHAPPDRVCPARTAGAFLYAAARASSIASSSAFVANSTRFDVALMAGGFIAGQGSATIAMTDSTARNMRTMGGAYAPIILVDAPTLTMDGCRMTNFRVGMGSSRGEGGDLEDSLDRSTADALIKFPWRIAPYLLNDMKRKQVAARRARPSAGAPLLHHW